jgi:hypothetical protein
MDRVSVLASGWGYVDGLDVFSLPLLPPRPDAISWIALNLFSLSVSVSVSFYLVSVLLFPAVLESSNYHHPLLSFLCRLRQTSILDSRIPRLSSLITSPCLFSHLTREAGFSSTNLDWHPV